MKKIYELENELKNLEQQKTKYKNVENMNITDFFNAKKLITKENNLREQINALNKLKKEAEDEYEKNTNNWISNLKINCRKYEKLERKAKYKKDKKLYKLGYIDARPTKSNQRLPLLISKIYSKLDKYNFLKPLLNKINNFVSNTFPKKINNLAIYTTKKCISGYRALDNDIKFYKNHIANIAPVKYLKSIKDEAIRQLDEVSEHDLFVKSLNPENFKSNYISPAYFTTSKPLIHHRISKREHIIG